LSVVNNPGFTIQIQKCTNAADPSQAACTSFTNGCVDTSSLPRNTINDCRPGATPRFAVSFTNPVDPNHVRPNPNDPNGGYHFKLQIVGDHQYLLDEVPVYIIPTEHDYPDPPQDPGSPGTFQQSGTYEQEVFGAGCNYYQLEGEGPGADSCRDGIDNNGDGRIDRGIDMNQDGDLNDPEDIQPDPGCVPGSCLDGLDNDGDGRADIRDPDCATTDRQSWTDLFFRADIPQGTAIDFLMCTAQTQAELSTACATENQFVPVTTVTSVTGACATNADCRGINVGGTVKDGFCGATGQCQFLEPAKVAGICTSDVQCPNGSINGQTISSTCDTGQQRCRYSSPPADLLQPLMQGMNGQPYVKMKIRLRANSTASLTPTLYDWYLTYYCSGAN
jgi:hypothetical protein